jgi:hypothetical protein
MYKHGLFVKTFKLGSGNVMDFLKEFFETEGR